MTSSMGGTLEGPFAPQAVVGSRGVSASTREAEGFAHPKHERVKYSVQRRMPAAQKIGLQLQQTAPTISAKRQRPDARILEQLPEVVLRQVKLGEGG